MDQIPEAFRGRSVVSLLEVANYYGVPKQTVKRRVWDGRLPAFRLGKDYRVKLEDAFSERTARLMEMSILRSEAFERQQVYFIGADHGPIKIGRAMSPEGRLKDIQNGYPYPLKILAKIEGSAGVEAGYHRKFARHRLNGEWFERAPEIEAEIERIRSALILSAVS